MKECICRRASAHSLCISSQGKCFGEQSGCLSFLLNLSTHPISEHVAKSFNDHAMQERFLMDSLIGYLSSTGIWGLFAIAVVGAIVCLFLSDFFVLIFAILVGFWTFAATENILIAIIVAVLSGAFFVFFSFIGHELLPSYLVRKNTSDISDKITTVAKSKVNELGENGIEDSSISQYQNNNLEDDSKSESSYLGDLIVYQFPSLHFEAAFEDSPSTTCTKAFGIERTAVSDKGENLTPSFVSIVHGKKYYLDLYSKSDEANKKQILRDYLFQMIRGGGMTDIDPSSWEGKDPSYRYSHGALIATLVFPVILNSLNTGTYGYYSFGIFNDKYYSCYGMRDSRQMADYAAEAFGFLS